MNNLPAAPKFIQFLIIFIPLIIALTLSHYFQDRIDFWVRLVLGVIFVSASIGLASFLIGRANKKR